MQFISIHLVQPLLLRSSLASHKVAKIAAVQNLLHEPTVQ